MPDVGVVVEALAGALGSTSNQTRAYSAEALGRIGPAAAVAAPGLRQLLTFPGTLEAAKAREALARIEGPRAPGP
jgi:hypothetical protein